MEKMWKYLGNSTQGLFEKQEFMCAEDSDLFLRYRKTRDLNFLFQGMYLLSE